MSLIHKKYIVGTKFNANDSIATKRRDTVDDSSQNPHSLTLDTHHSSHLLRKCETPCQNPYNYYFGQLEAISLPKDLAAVISPLRKSRLQSKEALSIGSLYKPDSSKSKSPLPYAHHPRIPPLSLKKRGDNNTAVKSTSQAYNIENSTSSSFRADKVKTTHTQASQTNVSRETKETKGHGRDISSYLDYLGQTSDSSCEQRLQRKLKLALMPRKNTEVKDHSRAGKMESGLLNGLLAKSKRSITDLNKTEISIERKRTLMPGSITEMQNSYANSRENSRVYRDNSRLNLENTQLNLDPHQNSRTNLSSPSKKSHSGPRASLRKGSLLLKKKPNTSSNVEHQNLLKDIALNLHDIYQHTLNERKFAHTIEELAQGDQEILSLVLAKYHGVSDYNPKKLEEKFAMIEILTETMPIPLKLLKKKEGIKLLEGSMLPFLQEFNRRLEDYNLDKRNEALKLVENSLEEIKSSIELRSKKKKYTRLEVNTTMMNKSNSSKFYVERRTPLLTDEDDPVSAVDKYQKNQLDYKFLKKRTLEYNRCVSGVFNEWSRFRNDQTGM